MRKRERRDVVRRGEKEERIKRESGEARRQRRGVGLEERGTERRSKEKVRCGDVEGGERKERCGGKRCGKVEEKNCNEIWSGEKRGEKRNEV